jgi:recombination protein RecA
MARKEDKQQEKEKATSERTKALELALAHIEKQFGKGSIMKLGEETHAKVESIPTGALSLDMAIGVGGIPRGRDIRDIWAGIIREDHFIPEYKSEAQKRGGVAAFIDAEHAFDSSYARKLGVNLDDLLISQPDSGEQALEICETLVKSTRLT